MPRLAKWKLASAYKLKEENELRVSLSASGSATAVQRHPSINTPHPSVGPSSKRLLDTRGHSSRSLSSQICASSRRIAPSVPLSNLVEKEKEILCLQQEHDRLLSVCRIAVLYILLSAQLSDSFDR